MHRHDFYTKEKAFFFAFWIVTVARPASMMIVDDPDLWGHVLYGMEHLSSGALSRVDPYSYTAYGAPWINHEWLCELLFALCWKTCGSSGLWAIRLLLIGATLGIVLKLITESVKGIWSGLLVYAFCWYEMTRGFAIRPQLFTFFFFSVSLFLIYRIYLQRTWSPWCMFAFVPLMGVWANLHGGFLVGIGLLIWLSICVLLEFLRSRMTRRIFILIFSGVLLSSVATLINPYGTGLWKWLYRSLLVSRSTEITEWAPMASFYTQWAIIPFYATVALMIILLIASRRKRDLFEWGLLLSLSMAALINNRHGILFCLAAAVILPKYLESLFPKLAVPRGFGRTFMNAVMVVSSLYALGVHFVPGHRPSTMLVETSKHPYNAFKFIHDNGLRGNMVVWFDWAQSAIWYLHDTCKVAFDGRFRTVYSKEVEDDYLHFHNLDSQWTNIIERYKTQIILMPENWPGVKALDEISDWQLVYRSSAIDISNDLHREGENAVLFVWSNMFPDFESRLQNSDIILHGARTVFRFGESINGDSD